MKNAAIFVIAVAMSWILMGAAWGKIIYVKAGATGLNNGTSWANAFTELQAALGAAAQGDEIWVAAGTYKPTSGTDRKIYFQMKTGVSMYGGFAGAETSRGQRNWTANVTILSGDIGIAGNKADNSFSIIHGANQATLDGFTVTNANDDDPYFVSYGVMVNDSVSPTIANCTFANNGNSAIYCMNNCSKITDCSFNDQVTAGRGAGMQIYESSPTLTNCNFNRNIASNSGGALCMGSLSGRNTPQIINCNFVENIANDNQTNTSHWSGGGAISNSCEGMVLIKCKFIKNAAPNAYGGAVLSYETELKDCTFIENSSNVEGGACFIGSDLLKMTNCVFKANTTNGHGGACAVGYDSWRYGSWCLIKSCVFYANSARGFGGAVFLGNNYWKPDCMLLNCTFTRNSAPRGGAVYLNPNFSPKLFLDGCILWNDHSPIGPEVNNSYLHPVYRNCDMQTCIVDGEFNLGLGDFPALNMDVDPQFVNPDNPEGPDGIWMTPDDGLQLKKTSPCINTGWIIAPSQDILGKFRNKWPDMGAYEFWDHSVTKNSAANWEFYD